MSRFKGYIEDIFEKNPYHKSSTGEFYDPTEEKESGSWSLYYSEPEKGRQRLKKGSRKRYSLPNKVIDKCGRSGELKCSTGKPSKKTKKKDKK
jgi:hypothetical protein